VAGSGALGDRWFRWRPLRRTSTLELWFGLGLIAALAMAGILAPLLGDPFAQTADGALSAPSVHAWFGTDTYGRDVFVRAVYSLRTDIPIGIGTTLLAGAVGTTAGLLSGYFGGWIDEIVQRCTDVLLAFPGFVLALMLVAVLGNGRVFLLIAIAMAYVPHFVRLVRAEVLRERELEYVAAAKLSGCSDLRVAFKHILPNALGPALVQGTLVSGWAILTAAGLAFLGVGVTPPTPELGVMVAEGAGDILTGQWWTSLIPGLLLFVLVAAFHMVGDGLGSRSENVGLGNSAAGR
jgi:peptide/nickel transport system permease protein